MPQMGSLEWMLQQAGYQHEDREQQKEKIQMWRCQGYAGDTLILDHGQPDYGKVFRFAMQCIAEMHNQGQKDFRVVVFDEKGNLYFFAIGESTQVSNFKNEKEFR